MAPVCSRWQSTRLPLAPRFARCLLLGVCLTPFPALSQTPRSNVGLPAAGAIGVHGGGARLERRSDGQEGGAFIDLGWLRGTRVRLQGEVAFLRGQLTETIVVEDSTYRGSFYDLSASATVVWLVGDASSRFAPYAVAGIGVHAMSSTFGTLVLDQRYNANRFGSEIGGGVRVRLGSGGRFGGYVEARRIIADEVNRTVVRGGALLFLGDLAAATR